MGAYSPHSKNMAKRLIEKQKLCLYPILREHRSSNYPQHLRPPQIPLIQKTATWLSVIRTRKGRRSSDPQPAAAAPIEGGGALTLESGRLKTLGSSVLPTMILCSLPGAWPPAPSAREDLEPWRSPATRSLVVFPMAAARVGGHLPCGTTQD